MTRLGPVAGQQSTRQTSSNDGQVTRLVPFSRTAVQEPNRLLAVHSRETAPSPAQTACQTVAGLLE